MNRKESNCAAVRRVLSLVAALVAVASTGCSARPAPARTQGHERANDRVEVLLDRGPERPFREVGRFEADGRNGEIGIERMREAAARAGLDGIYWIECDGRCFRHCTARGFVYDEPGERRE